MFLPSFFATTGNSVYLAKRQIRGHWSCVRVLQLLPGLGHRFLPGESVWGQSLHQALPWQHLQPRARSTAGQHTHLSGYIKLKVLAGQLCIGKKNIIRKIKLLTPNQTLLNMLLVPDQIFHWDLTLLAAPRTLRCLVGICDKKSPFFFQGATAGMRLLELEDPIQAGQILGNVSQALSESQFQFASGDAQILPGKQSVIITKGCCFFTRNLDDICHALNVVPGEVEGGDAWITINIITDSITPESIQEVGHPVTQGKVKALQTAG